MSTREKPVLQLAPPYDAGLIRHIEEEFTNLLGFTVQFRVVENPALLSGFVAYIRGVVYDASGKTQLTGIQKYLLDSVLLPAPVAQEEADT